MNPSLNLSVLAEKFKKRVTKLHVEATTDSAKIERYCIVAISQLNNLLRAHLLSIRLGAVNSQNVRLTFPTAYQSSDHLIDELIHVGFPKRWKPQRVGTWTPKDEPAYHTPRVFMTIVSALHPSNETVIQSALADSWKVDVLREVRNYFAHRSMDTEQKAITKIGQHYLCASVRASDLLYQYDQSISSTVLDDIHNYLMSFAGEIS
ncbi:MAG: hypothetical protein WBC07_09190 [Methylotenera sp.]